MSILFFNNKDSCEQSRALIGTCCLFLWTVLQFDLYSCHGTVLFGSRLPVTLVWLHLMVNSKHLTQDLVLWVTPSWGFQIHTLYPSWCKIIFQRNICLLLKLWRTMWIIALLLGDQPGSGPCAWSGMGGWGWSGRVGGYFPRSTSQGLQQGVPCGEPHGLSTPSSMPKGRAGGNATWSPLVSGFITGSFCSHSWKV